MKLIWEPHAEIHSAPLGVGPRADAFQALLDLHDFGDLEADEISMPCPSVALGGLRFTQLQRHNADACGQALTRWEADPGFPLQLMVTRDGNCAAYPASRCSAVSQTCGERHALAPSADGWLIGLPAILITRWLRVSPAIAAYRLDAERSDTRALGAYLHAWRFDELEAMVSPFEKELIAEQVMGLLAMAVSAHS